jgi:hypothetical protein
VFQGLVKGEISGFFKNIVEFNRDSIRGTFIEKRLDELSNRHKDDVITVRKNGKLTEYNINAEKNACKA